MSGRTGVLQESVRRYFAVIVTAALALALLPSVGLAQPQPVENPNDACPDPVNPPAPFTDRMRIPEVHRLNVDCAFNNDITEGYTDQTFRPSVIVRRDQFAAFMVRTLRAADVDLPAPSDQGFTDIRGNTHENDINILAQTGITAGTTATTYSPSLQLRRDQIGSFVLRAAAYIEDVPLERLQRDTGPFTDVPESNVHAPNINGARALNLTIGRTAVTYEPSIGTRRDQMASFLIRLLAALSDGSLIPPEDRAETLELVPETATNPTQTPHTLTATVRDDDNALLEGANVHFQVYRADNADGTFSGPAETGTARTNAQGQAGFTYTGPAASAADRIVACAARPDEPCQVTDQQAGTPGTQFTGQPQVTSRVFDTAAKRWVTPDERADSVTFTQNLAVNAVSTPHTATVTIRDAGNQPVQGANVRYEVYRAPTEAGTFSGPVEQHNTTTDAQGRASFTYTGPNEPAVDRIVACVPRQGSCQVNPVPFTGNPQIGAQPGAFGTKQWVVPAAADSLVASAYGLDVDLLGEEVIEQTPFVEIAMPPPADQEEATAELLEVPESPLTEIGALRVAARGDLVVGFAQGDAEAADVELLMGIDGDQPLITADAIRAVSTSTCPGPQTPEEAALGSQFVNLTIGDTEVPLDPGINFEVTIPGVAEVVVNEVVADPRGETFGHIVRGLRVTLLPGVPGVPDVPDVGTPATEIIVAEAHSAITCTNG